MSRLSPKATLAILLCAAAMLLVIGTSLARREQVTPQDRDRGAARRFANELQDELHRLERLYDSKLARLARSVPLEDKQAIWRACDEVVGVRQFSVIHRVPDHGLDWHLAVEPPQGVAWPEPTFTAEFSGLPRSHVLLPETIVTDQADESGWVESPGKPLVFWQRRSTNEFIALLIDEKAVATAFDGWLAEWLPAAFAPVAAAGGPDIFSGPEKRVFSRAGAIPTERSDLILPVRTRFGEWQLASWDRHHTQVSFHLPTLVASAAVAAVVALLGVFVSTQQRAAIRHAESRVSFVNAISHELRAPLTNILLNVELAQEGLDEAQAESARRLGLVQEESHRLRRLIDNVLSFSAPKHRSMAMGACAPASLVHAVVAQFAPAYARRALVVEYRGELHEPVMLAGDALMQIVSNLLSNIEKYVPGGIVTIETRFENGMLSIIVSDEGPGIPARDAERIFLPFERLGGRVNEGPGGAGLGLAISRDLARQMGGTLTLRPGERGASFELKIPAQPVALPRAVEVA